MKKLFIHIPKNGGMTIRHRTSIFLPYIITAHQNNLPVEYANNVKTIMNEHGYKSKGYEHARWIDFKASLTQQYEAFAIVRNPWDKVVSRYTYALSTNSRPSNFTFEEFLEERHSYGDIPFFWHRAIKGWYPQIDHVMDENNTLKCDILRFEYYDADIMKYFNSNKKLIVQNMSNGKHSSDRSKVVNKIDYREYYNNTTKEIVGNWYAKDITFFGFTFDSSATKNIWNISQPHL